MHDENTPSVGNESLENQDETSEIAAAESSPDPLSESKVGTVAVGMPTKVCANCSVQSQTDGQFCPNCGKAFNRARKWDKRTLRIAAVILAAVVVLGGGGAVVAQTVAHNNEVAMQAADAKKAKAAADAETERAAAAARAKDAADTAERARRETSVAEIEASITKDAQGRVKDGSLDGPILKSSCTPLGGGSSDILTALTTTFTCIAISKENADGTASGYRFSATMDWDAGSYSWHLGD